MQIGLNFSCGVNNITHISRTARKKIFKLHLWRPLSVSTETDEALVLGALREDDSPAMLDNVYQERRREGQPVNNSLSANVVTPVVDRGGYPIFTPSDTGCQENREQKIPVVKRRRPHRLRTQRRDTSNSLIYLKSGSRSPGGEAEHRIPNIYIVNPGSLAKPFAIEQLAADVSTFEADVVIVSETWFKAKHLSSTLGLPGYVLYRHDRPKRTGGGVAIYVSASMQLITTILLLKHCGLKLRLGIKLCTFVLFISPLIK